MESPKITLKIEGMDCSSCAVSISRTIEKNNCTNVNVNFATGEASFDLLEQKTLPKVIADISSLGYKVVDREKEHVHGFSGVEKKFYFTLIFTVPLFLHMFLPSGLLHDPLVQLSLCIPVFLTGLFHFGKSAWGSVKVGAPNMDVLIFIGSSSAFFYSLAGMIMYRGTHEVHQYLFFETCATIITLVLLGNVLEHRSVRQTTTAIRDLTRLQASRAKVVRVHGGKETIEETDFNKIQINDIIQVNMGDKVPVDGEIISGNASVDESMLTGEGLPAEKSQTSKVVGGTIAVNGNFRMKAETVGENTVLSKIIELVKTAQNEKPRIQKLGDRISEIFVPLVLLFSALTFLISYFFFNIPASAALMNSVAVLVISCPCAMGLATPTAVMVGIGRAAKNGILIKGGSTLEEFAKVRTIVFDKTGTLTTGNFRITDISAHEGVSVAEIKGVLHAMEQRSSHPIARSIVTELAKENGPQPKFAEITEERGLGISAMDEHGNRYRVGSYKIASGLTKDDSHNVYMLKNNRLAATIDLEDSLKANVEETISVLKRSGIETVLLSGDTHKKVNALAAKTGIAKVFSEKHPAEKLVIIEQLVKENSTAMVGDGINDAPALAKANVGISVSNATQIAVQSAQVILLNGNDISQLALAHQISKHTLLTIKQNLFWAFFYNVVAIPVAAFGFLSPMIGALAMAFSDVIVIGNSIRLKTKKLN